MVRTTYGWGQIISGPMEWLADGKNLIKGYAIRLCANSFFPGLEILFYPESKILEEDGK